MCGRIVRTSPKGILMEEFGVTRVAGDDFAPRYNIPPSQRIDTIVAVDHELRLGPMHWGFTVSAGMKTRPINARSETVSSSPLFRASFHKRRCLVVADGFYEWQREGTRKRPFFIHMRSERPFGIAGIWTSCREGDEPPLFTCALLTCGPNEMMGPIHDRMPVILPHDRYRKWLDPDTPQTQLQGMLRPFAAEFMEAWEVSPRVNSPRNNGPECLAPLEG